MSSIGANIFYQLPKVYTRGNSYWKMEHSHSRDHKEIELSDLVHSFSSVSDYKKRLTGFSRQFLVKRSLRAALPGVCGLPVERQAAFSLACALFN